MNDNDMIITLTDDKNVEYKYEILDLNKKNDNLYLVLYPVETDDTEVLIVRVEDAEDPEKSRYIVETDEKIVNDVYKDFKEKYKDEIEFKED